MIVRISLSFQEVYTLAFIFRFEQCTAIWEPNVFRLAQATIVT